MGPVVERRKRHFPTSLEEIQAIDGGPFRQEEIELYIFIDDFREIAMLQDHLADILDVRHYVRENQFYTRHELPTIALLQLAF